MHLQTQYKPHHEGTLVDVLSWGVIKEFSVIVYLSTKHKNKHSNCQPFDLFIVPVQESSDPPVDQPPQSPSSPEPSGKKIGSRKFNGTCIWYKRTFDLFNVHIFINLLILFSFHIFIFNFYFHLPKDDVRVSFGKWRLLIFLRINLISGRINSHPRLMRRKMYNIE